MRALNRNKYSTEQSVATASNWVALENIAFGFARVCCRRSHDAQDIAHEALAELAARHEQVENPIPWLFVVTRRIAARIHRRNRHRIEAEHEWSSGTSVRMASVDGESFALLIHQTSLTPKQRRLLLYRAVGYTDVEIAKKIACSPRSVATLVARAVSTLRRSRFFD